MRAFRPAAARVLARPEGGEPVELTQRHPAGLFEGEVAGATLPLRYELEVEYAPGESYTMRDPYAFAPTLGEIDLYLAGEGRHEELYEKLGAHLTEIDGATGVAFAVWAPSARSVSVVGDFNSWDGRLHPMRSLGASGIWELFIPGVAEGSRYKFELRAQDGDILLRADPFAFETELPPKTASVVNHTRYEWTDDGWMELREQGDRLREPMSIYEVHLGSWRLNPLEDNRSLTYLELADELAAYVTDMGFTHVELMPVMAHPFSGSWGYQVTSYFAPTPRFGTPDQFRAFVDRLHEHGVGVILDWVPAHFPRDEWALARFDGSALFEHADPRRGSHPDWGTLIFNFGRLEVRNFLLASALYWLREYHTDGIRVDAVASMLYLDYSRKEGQWVPNEFGGREDLEAVSFLKELNTVAYGREPGIVSAAEESTAWPGVSRPDLRRRPGLRLQVEHGLDARHAGLLPAGPDPPPLPPPRADLLARLRLQRELHPAAQPRRGRPRQGLDVTKMPGDRWQKLANLRALYAYMWAHPGKKLLFMGCEFAQESEWSHERSLDWHLLENPENAGIQSLVRDLNRVYRERPAMWEIDDSDRGFYWLEPNDAANNVVAFCRTGKDPVRDVVAVVCNFSPVPREGYRLGLPQAGRWVEVVNTDAAFYGGSNIGNLGGVDTEDTGWSGQPFSAELTLPPLSVLWLVPER